MTTSALATSFDRDAYLRMDLLRLLTCGSVDDGKSTLIGRLLYDSKTVFEDQLDAVREASLRRGGEGADLALLTDGLRAEREQGITIDVAYRYFATPRRKFIVADCPGHVQYTRNMATGASTANLAIVLVDARHGVTEQTRRHAFIASLLRIRHLCLVVNKMDLVDWDEQRFEQIRADFEDYAARLEITDVRFIPASALHGDNIVDRSVHTPWYNGATLLHHLEHVHVAADRDLIDPRLPVQWVIRPQTSSDPDYRGYAGQIAAGVFRVGDEVCAMPSGFVSEIKSIRIGEEAVEQAAAPQSVAIELADDLDIARGDLLCRPHNKPEVSQDVEAMLVWMHDQPMTPSKKYAIKHTTRWGKCMVTDLRYRMDVGSLSRDTEATELGLNDIGRVRVRTTSPLLFDPYRTCRETGSFVVVDEVSNVT
ncbi:MAG: GTP-binding protein, partial [Planctomycetota bacterium]